MPDLVPVGIIRPVRTITLLLVGMLVLATAGLGAAVVVYDRVAGVAADCDARFGDNSPASWSVLGISSAVPDFDASDLLVTEYQEVRVPSRDEGIDLRAWWLPAPGGPRAPAVVVVHGFGTCVRDPAVLAPAGMLRRLGYGLLMLDLRDHGGSTVEDGYSAAGSEEYRDVLGAVDWLVAAGAEPGRIGLMGTSMGAATAIIAAGQDERIAAVWADSSYSDTETLVADGLEGHSLPRSLAFLALPVARFVSGDDLGSPSVLGELAAMRGRHLYIVHGELDGLIDVSHAATLAEAARSAGVLVEQWIVSDAGHVDVALVHPERYERRLGEFFGSAFGS
jgi:fermentation-respiration switch protein FrsA (DUF1100 family)